MTLDELIRHVGTPYQQLDQDGKALGCMLPVYLLYPEIPRYDWPGEGTGFGEAVYALLQIHGRRIEPANIQPGDVVAFVMPFGWLHIGVYLGDDKIIHCMTGDDLEMCRLSFIARRLKGVFRWEQHSGGQ